MEKYLELQNDFLNAALTGNKERANSILMKHPEIIPMSIHIAAVLGNVDVVRTMVEKDYSLAVNAGGPWKVEPLLYLCFSSFLKDTPISDQFVQITQLLLEQGANPNTYIIEKDDPYERKLPALYGAVGLAGNAAIGRILLDAGADPNDGETLYHAAELNRLDCLDLLAEYGADVNITPALFRNLDFDDEAGVQWFLEHGVDPNLTLGDLKNSLLHWAVYRGRSLSIIERLLKHNVPVNARRNDGKTAYMLAVRFGQTQAAQLLLQYGASNVLGPTDLIIGACALADKDTLDKTLLDNPTFVASLTDDDKMMLLEFVQLGKAGSIDLMIDIGFDKEISRAEGTALHISAWFGDRETVRVLLRRGASLWVRNSYGGTPLESAIHGSINYHSVRASNYTDVVEALIEAGSAIPAKASGSSEVYEVLRRYGASV